MTLKVHGLVRMHIRTSTDFRVAHYVFRGGGVGRRLQQTTLDGRAPQIGLAAEIELAQQIGAVGFNSADADREPLGMAALLRPAAARCSTCRSRSACMDRTIIPVLSQRC